MEYVLVKASIEPDWSHATLWFANPNCVFEKPHRIYLFNEYQIGQMMCRMSDSDSVNKYDLPIDLIPEQFHTIQAEYIEVDVGLHKHVSRRGKNGLPVYTRKVCVFAPLVRCKCSGEYWRYLYDPKQLAQEQINRYWIPVDED